MPIAVGNTAVSSGAFATTATATLTVTAGASLHLFIVNLDTVLHSFTISDNNGNTWKQFAAPGDCNDYLNTTSLDYHAYANNCVGGSTTITVTWDVAILSYIAVKEITGTSGYDSASLCAMSGFYTFRVNTPSGTDTATSGKTNKLSASPALYSAFIRSGGTPSVGTGYTQDLTVSNIIGANKRVTVTTPDEALYSLASPSKPTVVVAVFLETGAQPDPQPISWSRG